MTSTKDTSRYLALASPISMHLPSRVGPAACVTEKDYWQVLVTVCDLSRRDIRLLYDNDYNTMTRLSMLGLNQNNQGLVEIGLSPGKAHMVYLFATYLLHCMYHHYKVSKELTLEHVLEFNFLLANPDQEQYHTLNNNSGHSRSSISSKTLKVKRSSVSSTSSKNAMPKSNSAPKLTMKRGERSYGSLGSIPSFASKSTMRSEKSSNTLKSVSWHPNFQYPQPLTTSTHSRDSATNSCANSRWSNSASAPKKTNSTDKIISQRLSADAFVNTSQEDKPCDSKVRPPNRRGSLDESAKRVIENNVLTLDLPVPVPVPVAASRTEQYAPPPPESPVARATLRWAQALDVDEDLTDSDWSESSGDDSDSDSDDDDDLDEEDEDDDDDDEEDEEEDVGKKQQESKQVVSKSNTKAETKVSQWNAQNLSIGEWTLPANQVLPVKLQDLFRQASQDPEIDVQEQIHKALMMSQGGRMMMVPPSAA